MDEVLRALNEKESKLESPEKETTPLQEDTKISWEETQEKKQSPPPLPAQPPRMVGWCFCSLVRVIYEVALVTLTEFCSTSP